MVTYQQFSEDVMRKSAPYFSPLKTTIETAFYENHVKTISSLEEAYRLASQAPTTVVLDMEVAHAGELGLPKDAKVLLANGGAVVGRTAKARRILGQKSEEDAKLLPTTEAILHLEDLLKALD